MSGPLVSRVLDSALPSWLKVYAVALASFAAVDGSQIFPSMRTLARLVGKSERSAQRAVAELRARGVILQLQRPGHQRAAHYQLREDALPQPGAPDQLPLFPQGLPRRAHRAARHFSTVSTGTNTTPVTRRPDTGVTRSVSDPSSTPHLFARARKGR